MIQKITIQNYKSISDLEMDLGRINVLIGENGCGKSNILEAIAMGCAASANKLDNEFLVSRGIRVTNDPGWMRSAFNAENMGKEIQIGFYLLDSKISFSLQNDNQPYSSWHDIILEEGLLKKFQENPKKIEEVLKAEVLKAMEEVSTKFKEVSKKIKEVSKKIEQLSIEEEKNLKEREEFLKQKEKFLKIEEEISKHVVARLSQFFIYSPENTVLRKFEEEGQIEPLGIKGEGLFKFLRYLKSKDRLDEIKDALQCLGWFEDFDIPEGLFSNERKLKIQDRYLEENLTPFDPRYVNEGFLFLLFYFCLFSGEETPPFFAIDNIDASLNPKLCSDLMLHLVEMAKKHDKQAIITTHNPCILDGLNLDDPEQRLFVVYRNSSGHTRIKRIFKPQTVEGEESVSLSVAFIRGYIGGLPKGF